MAEYKLLMVMSANSTPDQKKMQAKQLTCKKQSSTKLIFTQTLHSDTTS